MTKEAYCSYEVCKLLKEKGFEGWCDMSYNDKGDLLSNLLIGYDEGAPVIVSNQTIFPYKAPTQQMAMRYLREEHNLYIQVEFDSKDFFIADIYDMVKVDDTGSPYHYSPTIVNCKTYEETVEAAVKYCLENLL